LSRYSNQVEYLIVDGVDFAPAFARRIAVQFDGHSLNFISLDDFKTNKRTTGRHKDLADLDALDGASPDPV
jgi:hypothetical protein